MGSALFAIRRSQLPESAIIYLATASAATTLLLIAAAIEPEASEILALWLPGLLVGFIPHLAGTRPLTICLLTLVTVSTFAVDPGPLLAMSLEQLFVLLGLPALLMVMVPFSARRPLLAPALMSLAGILASFYWSLPMLHLYSGETDPISRFLTITGFISPSVMAVALGRFDAPRFNFGWLLPVDLREGLFRVVGVFSAGLAGLGIASWVTIQLRSSLLATPLESAITVSGWFAGALAAGLLLWAVLRLPAVFGRGQLAGRLDPLAVAESMWMCTILGSFAIYFELSLDKFGPIVLITLCVLIVYAAVRILYSAPLPAGQSPLWVVTLQPATRALRGTVRRLAATWKLGPTTLLSLPEAAKKLAYIHLRACVKTRTLDRLFPLRSAHLSDWDEGLPSQQAWNSLPVRELYANEALWPEILAARLNAHSLVIALESGDSGVMVEATTDSLRLRPSLPSGELETIASQRLASRQNLLRRLKVLQKVLRARSRYVFILHAAADTEAAWELRARLAGIHDGNRAIVHPIAIRFDEHTLPTGACGQYQALVRRMLERKPGAFGLSGLLLRHMVLRFSAPRSDGEYDLIAIEPGDTAAPGRVAYLMGNLVAGNAFDRIVALKSPGDSNVCEKFLGLASYSDTIFWNSAPTLTDRVADAVQKLLAVKHTISAQASMAEPAQVLGETIDASVPATAGTAIQMANTEDGETATHGIRQLRHEKSLVYAAFNPVYPLIVTTSRDCTAQLWNSETGENLRVSMRHKDTVRHADFGRAAVMLATAGKDGVVQLWDGTTGTPLGELPCDDGPVNHVVFDRGGERLVSCGGITARVWDVQTRRQLLELRHEGPVVRAEFSPNGGRVLTCSFDNTARVWEATTGEPIGSEMRHIRAVRYATFSPDGRTVATASEDGSARVWNAYTGEPLGSMMRHDKPIHHVIYGADGRMLATASADGFVRLWDAQSGRALHDWALQHPAAVNCIAFSSDCARLLSACDDSLVREWDARTGALLNQRELEGRVYYVAYSPDGKSALGVDSSNAGKLWSV